MVSRRYFRVETYWEDPKIARWAIVFPLVGLSVAEGRGAFLAIKSLYGDGRQYRLVETTPDNKEVLGIVDTWTAAKVGIPER